MATETGDAAPFSPSPPFSGPGGRERILLVEDEFVVRQLMAGVLRSRGYDVREAASADEALKVWDELAGAIDLLVTDMVMPGDMGGGALTARLRAVKPELPVLQCSGYERNPADAGGTDVHFLQKPFTVRVLLQSIRECLA